MNPWLQQWIFMQGCDSLAEVRLLRMSDEYMVCEKFAHLVKKVAYTVKTDLYFAPQNSQNDLYFRKHDLLVYDL